MVKAAAAPVLLLISAEARSETVDVKYRGPVDLKTFECRDVNRSSFIQRVCYDKAQSYMVISLKGTYYHYCERRAVNDDAAAMEASRAQHHREGSGRR